MIAIAAVAAVYGTHVINNLRRQVFEAKQLGQYHLVAPLDSGGMGEVYLAEHRMLKRPCAVKLIRPEQAGDPQAPRLLIERYQGAVFGLCYRMLSHRQDAEDAAQETFLRALRAMAGFDAARPLRPWLLTLLVLIACKRSTTSPSDGGTVDACAILFGSPNAYTGLGPDQCRPDCACNGSVFQPPAYSATFIQSLIDDFVLTTPYPPLTTNPYTLPVPPDDPAAWVLDIGPEGVAAVTGHGGDTACTLSGRAADLYRALWHRGSAAAFDVEGDRSVLDVFLDGVQVRWS